MERIRGFAGSLWARQGFRYLFFGGLTVGVSTAAFALLARAGLGLDGANALSIALALLFAYVTNTRFVFRSKTSGGRERLGEFLRFLSARLFTMGVEFFGVHFLAEVLLWNGFFSKLATQAVVIVLNYVLSKIIVYKSV